MARANQTTRDYSKADDIMLEQAQTMRNSFDTDSAAFTAMYPMFDLTFSADWQADIDAAQALPTADEENMELKAKTEDVDTEMELCRVHYQLMASYIKLLFPNSPAKQGLFGLNKYESVRNVQTKMYDLMQLADRKCNDAAYTADLIALGFAQTQIDKLAVLATALYDTNEAQEDYKQTVKLNTEARIAAYNKVWGTMKQVSAASKQVFLDDYAKLAQYKLYPEGEGGLGKPQNLTAVLDPVVPDSVNVDFDAVADATEYKIYGSEVSIGDPSGIFHEMSSSATNHFDMPIIQGMRNYWKVRAFNDTQSSTYSDEVFLDS